MRAAGLPRQASMRSSWPSSCSGSLPSGPLPPKSQTTMLLAPLDEVASRTAAGAPAGLVHLALVAAHARTLAAVEIAEIDGAVGEPARGHLQVRARARASRACLRARTASILPPSSVRSTNIAPLPATTSSSRPRQHGMGQQRAVRGERAHRRRAACRRPAGPCPRRTPGADHPRDSRGPAASASPRCRRCGDEAGLRGCPTAARSHPDRCRDRWPLGCQATDSRPGSCVPSSCGSPASRLHAIDATFAAADHELRRRPRTS